MNKVSIISFSLHKKYVVQNDKDYTQGTNLKSTNKRRNRSPEQTLKRLIKKGRLHYVNPYLQTKQGKRIISDKENNPFRHSQGTLTETGTANVVNKLQASNSTFTCSRGHKTNFNSKLRVSTEEKQKCSAHSRYRGGRACEGDLEDFQPPGSFIFRDFRNITEQSLERLRVENQRRFLKMTQFHQGKYDEVWSKHPLPSVSKQKNLGKSIIKSRVNNLQTTLKHQTK